MSLGPGACISRPKFLNGRDSDCVTVYDDPSASPASFLEVGKEKEPLKVLESRLYIRDATNGERSDVAQPWNEPGNQMRANEAFCGIGAISGGTRVMDVVGLPSTRLI